MQRYLCGRWLVVVVACSAALAIAGIAFASIPDSSGVIHVCYAATGSGALNVYDPSNTDGSVPTSCVKGQASLSFNQTGPAGPQGPAGHLPPAVVAAAVQNLGQVDSSLTGLRTAIAGAVSQQRQQRAAFRKLMRKFLSAKTVAAQLSTAGEMSDETSLALQEAMDRQSKFMTTLSNLMKKIADTDSADIQNLK
jgi:hypothetical protein